MGGEQRPVAYAKGDLWKFLAVAVQGGYEVVWSKGCLQGVADGAQKQGLDMIRQIGMIFYFIDGAQAQVAGHDCVLQRSGG